MKQTQLSFPYPLHLVHTVHGPRLGWKHEGQLMAFPPGPLQQCEQQLSAVELETIGELNFAIADAAAAALKAATKAFNKAIGGPMDPSLNGTAITMDLLRQALIEGVVVGMSLDGQGAVNCLHSQTQHSSVATQCQ